MNLLSQRQVGAVYLLPFVMFFALTGTSVLQQLTVNASNQSSHQDGSVINQIFLSSSYFIALFLLMRRAKQFGYMLARAYPLMILLFFIGLSAFWSMFPFAVLISLAHQSGTVLVAMCTGILWLEDKDKFLKMLLKLFFLYLLITIVVCHVWPSIGRMPVERWNPGGKWRGMTTHSNTLGMFCLVSVWFVIASFFLIQKNSKLLICVALLDLVMAFYLLHGSNSMTSTLLSLALCFSALSFVFLKSSSSQEKALKMVLLVFFSLIVLAVVYIVAPDLFSIKNFFKLIGRREDLTGRTSLWELGMNGIAQHPYIGWSFDGLRSFLFKYSFGYGQLHNGYFDLTMRGGFVAIFLFFLMLLGAVVSLLKIRKIDHKGYYFVSALFVAILMHNLTEASFFRNTHFLWLMFLVLYFYSMLARSKFYDKNIYS